MKELCQQIKDQIKLYEEEMISAMAEGKERVRQVYDDFEKNVGREVGKLALTAPEPLRGALLSLFNDTSWSLGENGDKD